MRRMTETNSLNRLPRILGLFVIVLGLTALFAISCSTARKSSIAGFVSIDSRVFRDLEILLEGGQTLGSSNLSDFWRRIDEQHPYYNYPRAFAWCAKHISALASLREIAGLQLIIFIIAAIAVWLRVQGVTFWLAVPLMFSPAVALALERANTDLTIFAFIVLGTLGLSSNRRIVPPAGLALLCASAALKIYPMFVLMGRAVVLPGKKRVNRTIIGCICVILLVSLEDVLQAAHRTQARGPMSYGMRVPEFYLRYEYAEVFEKKFRYIDVQTAGYLLTIGILAATCCGAVFLIRRGLSRFWAFEGADANGLWIAAAAIYVGTYLAGANFDYRLVFLTMLVPGISRLSRPMLVLFSSLLLGLFWFGLWPANMAGFRVLFLGAQWILCVLLIADLYTRWLEAGVTAEKRSHLVLR
jgi:hypothetical protein